MALYLAVFSPMPGHLALSSRASKKLAVSSPSGEADLHASQTGELAGRDKDLWILRDLRGDQPILMVEKLPRQAAHGHYQVQNAQNDTGTRQFQSQLRTAAPASKEGVQRRKAV